MLYLVTGVPGASKTAYTVTQLDKIERDNKINLAKNKEIHAKNQKLIEKYQDDFSYIEVETGSAHELKLTYESLPSDYFSIFSDDFDDLRPDDYYKRSTEYNEIIERINDRDGSQGFRQLLPVRTIYSNIKALKIDYARANIYDWRHAPDGAVFAIDEVQLVEPYCNLKDKQNDIVQELTIHRHRGFDFYFITQAPSLLHPTIKELIGVHYHITRPYGRTPKVYQFGSCRAYPNTLVNKLNCEAKFSFKPSDRIFKLYKSTTINTHKPRYPTGLLGFGAFVICAFCLFLYGLNGAKKSTLLTNKPLTTVKTTHPAPTENQNTSLNHDKNNDKETQSNTVSNIDSEVIRVAAIFESTNNCHAYNGRGDLLDMSITECRKYSKNPRKLKKAEPGVVDKYLQAVNYNPNTTQNIPATNTLNPVPAF